MSNTLKLSLVVTVMTITGCQLTPTFPPLPKDTQTNLVTAFAISGFCYNNGHFPVEEHVGYQQMFQYSLNTWSYDYVSVNNELVEVEKELKQASIQAGKKNIAELCKVWRPNLMVMKNNADKHKKQLELNQQRQHEINKARASAPKTYNTGMGSSSGGFSGTVNCQKMGRFINVEIKTFRGMVCPIGWLPATGW